LEVACSNEETYLNELVAYQLQFEGYTFDWLTGKLVEVLVTVSQKLSLVHVTTTRMSFRIKLVVTTTKELEPIEGVKLAIVSCTLSLPT
jgi:hypothetical protein